MKRSVLVAMIAGSISFWGCSSKTSPVQDAGQDAGLDAGPDAGQATLSLSAVTVDFGQASCGGVAPANQTVTLTNSGTSAVTFALTITGNGFGFTDPASGSIDAGGTHTFTLTAPPVLGTATAGAKISDTFTLTSNSPLTPVLTVALTETPAGAAITLSPPTASFGQVAKTATATTNTLPITVTNAGNLPVVLNVGAPTSGDFSLTGNAISGGQLTVQPGSPITLAANFTPHSTTALTDTISLNPIPTSVLCGASVSSLAYEGQGVVGAVTVSGDLDFGLTNCGSAAAPKTVTIGNIGQASVHYSAALSNGGSSPFTVSPTSGDVAVGQTATVTVIPKLIPGAVPSLPGNFGDTLTIGTNVPSDPPHVINLTQGAQGAILSFNPPAPISFGLVNSNSTQTSGVTVQNTGNLPANVTLSTNNAVFGVSPATSTAVGGGSSSNASVSYSPVDTSAQTANLALAVVSTDVLCQPLPSALPLSGTGQNGGISTSVSSFDFGSTNCGATASAKTFNLTFTNSAAGVTAAFTAALGNLKPPNNFYTLACAPAPGSSATCSVDSKNTTVSGNFTSSGQSVVVTVTPLPVPVNTALSPADLYADAITINSTFVPAGSLPSSTTTVNLHQSAQGALISMTPSPLDFGSIPVNTTTTGGFQITNNGNAPVKLTLSTTDAVHFTVPAGQLSLAAGANTTLNANFLPKTTTIPLTASLNAAPDSTTPVCNSATPQVAPISLKGQGTNGQIAFSAATLNFGNVNCGSTGSAQQITVTNSGNQAFKLSTVSLASGNGSPYTVTANPVIGTDISANGGTATLTVTPKGIPQYPATFPGNYGDTLNVTTTITNDVNHAIALSEIAQGAVLSLSTTNLNFPSTPLGSSSTFQLAVTNKGNSSATIQFNNAAVPFTFDQNLSISGGASGTPNAYFTPTSAPQTYSGTADFAVANGTVLCKALPTASLALSGTSNKNSTVAFSPNSLNIGSVNCGSTGPVRTFTITNTGSSTANWTATLQNPSLGGTSYYVLSTGGTSNDTTLSGTVPAGGASTQVTVTVTPKLIPASLNTSTTANAFGDTIILSATVGTVSVGSSNIQLLETAQGGVLNLNVTQLRQVRGGITGTNQVIVYNTGNIRTGQVNLSVAPSSNPYTVTPLVFSVANGGQNTGVSLSISNTATAPASATVTLTSTTPLCQEPQYIPTLALTTL